MEELPLGKVDDDHRNSQTTASHAIGETTPALLRGTISANLDATIARFGDREALIDRAQGIRWTYAAFGAEVGPARPGVDGRRTG